MMRAGVALLVLALSAGAYADQSAQATSGSSAGALSGSSAGAQVGDTSVHLNQYSATHIPKPAMNSSAAIMLSGCQEGASGTGAQGALAGAIESPTCVALRQAQAHQQLYTFYKERGDSKTAARHMRLMEEYVTAADVSADVTKWPKTVGSTVMSLLPIGLFFLF
jgi:hypothetical protein